MRRIITEEHDEVNQLLSCRESIVGRVERKIMCAMVCVII